MESRFLAQTRFLVRNLAKFATTVSVVVAMCCSQAFAQSGAGSIQGTVTDSTGAVISGASIHVANQSTGVASDTKTNGVGYYQVPDLFAGTYVVSTTAPGMQTNQRTIELLVAQNATVNSTLTAGDVTQKVEVKADTVQLITTDNGAITSTLENQRINELPMNGRNIISLVNETTPGLESCPESGSCANGQEGPALEYEVDGATLTNREFGGVHMGSQQMVDPDSIQEVHVEDEAGGAQYAAPATVVMNTKGGTNQFHGSLFETARNNAFGIARNRNNPSGSAYVAPELIRNEFGVSVGGPVRIPHLYNGRDKTFFFFAYERYSQASKPYQSVSVPTPQMLVGDFSQLTNGSGVPQVLYDPATTTNNPVCAGGSNVACRQTFTQEYNEGPGSGPANCNGDTNCIPANEEAPLTKTLNAMTPTATGPNGVLSPGVSPLAKANYQAPNPSFSVEPQITWRFDQIFNENNRAYVRYTQNITTGYSLRNDPAAASNTLAATTPGGIAIPAGASGISYNPNNVYAAAIGFTHVFSTTFYSETVLSESWIGEHNYAGGTPKADFEQEMGLPNNFGEVGFPEITGNFSQFGGTQFQYSVTATTYNADENLTKIIGKHQLLFGGRYRFEHIGSIPDEIKDAFQFGDYATALLNASTYGPSAASATANTGNANADMFLGAAYSYSNNIEPPYQHFHDMELDGYIQDNYRARSNLTFNIGLRYEAHPAMYEANGAMMGFDLKNDAIVTSGSTAQLIAEGLTTQAVITNDMLNGVKFETPSQAGLPPMLVNSYDFTFGPRVGAAWQPFGPGKMGTVLRGGLGRYIYPVPIREEARLVNRNNPFTAGYSESYTSSTYTPHTNYMMLSSANSSPGFNNSTTTPTSGNGWPIMGSNSTNLINTSTTTALTPGLSIVSINPDNPPSYVDEANFTIEQPLKWNSLLRVSYLYTHGTNLNNSFYYNDHPSAYSWEIQQGAPVPANPGSAVSPYNGSTGQGPYDNLTFGSGSYQIQKTGWSNYNALQVNYQRLFKNGYAWQVMYVWEKNLRTGGDYGGENGDAVDPYSSYVNSYVGNYVGAGANTVSVAPVPTTVGIAASLPGAPNLPPPPPAGVQPWQYYKALNRWENYMVDTNTPPQHLQFNFLIDFPFGRGKRWLGTVNKPLNEVVGGWQLAGAGRVTVTDFAITNTNWGPTNPLKKYKKSVPITDCTSGTCLKEYEWFNGYIAPTAITGGPTVNGNAYGCAGSSAKTVTGLPTSWMPYQTPLDISCAANGATPTTDKNFGTNDVAISGVTGLAYPGAAVQKNGTVIAYGVVPSNNDNGASEGAIDVTNPFAHTIMTGPTNWGVDASLFKVFPIWESMNLRVNFDAFNVFNNQGLGNPNGTTGETCITAGQTCSSQNTPRQLQISARLTF